MSETYADQVSRVRMMAEGSATWDLSDNDTAALTAVLERLDALESMLVEQRSISCTYCGHEVFIKNLTPEEAQRLINDHIFACEKRPEAGLLLVVGGLLNALGVDVDSIPKDAGREGVLNASVDAVANLMDELAELRKAAKP